MVNFHSLLLGMGRISGSSNDTILLLLYVHVRPSGLKIPVSLLPGRQLTAAAAVVFQQLLLASQEQSKAASVLDPHALRIAAPPIKTTHRVICIEPA